MRCLFLANCGILLQTENASLAVDTPNGAHTLFDGLPEEVLKQMAAGEAPFEHLRGFLFTHRHSDHYDKKRLHNVLVRRPELTSLSPSGVTPESGEFVWDPFRVRYCTIPHSGVEFSSVSHRVYLISADGKTVYVTGDADWSPERHLAALDGCKPDLAVWNSNVFTHEESRKLLERSAKNVINHLPLFSDDTLGVGRKCASVRTRIGSEYPNVFFADQPGFSVEI